MAKIAFVFPGQGAQYVGMGLDLYREDETVRSVFAEAGQILGIDIAALCFEGPQEILDLTVNTQIAVLTLDIAIYHLVRKTIAVSPAVLAGHSLGEYAALYAAGALRMADLLPLVYARAQYHQEAVSVGTGAMAAIMGLSDQTVADLCRAAQSETQTVGLAICNAPNQAVISGHAAAVEKVMAAAEKTGGAKALKLPISVPCHCRLLDPAARWLRADLEKVAFDDFETPVIPNCDPDVFYTKENARELLTRQITSPVKWQETIERMGRLGVDTIVEIGPRRTLSGLIKRIDRKMQLLNVEDVASLKKAAFFSQEKLRPIDM
ncbi:MAG: [acyl-carrier-protein] S-malonyltransferase [Syntrophus sp. (in: bacteria)]|nr:[acyl-carrier-protein] S-malonyltransferase [Syntrophus sp. (in: bacteria)]